MFITLEGIDFSGKSTQAKYISDFYTGKGKKVFLTKEPGGSALGEKIRELILKQGTDYLSQKTLLMLILANRADHLEKVIRPKLAEGYMVVCDRYFDSTIAYQVGGAGLDINTVGKMVNFISEGLSPDLTLFLDIPPRISFLRAKPEQLDSMEHFSLSYFEKAYATYQTLCQNNPHRIAKIDAQNEAKFVFGQICKVINERIKFVDGERYEDLEGKLKTDKNF